MSKTLSWGFTQKEKAENHSLGITVGMNMQNRGSKNRTRIDGFGDRCSTVELCPLISLCKAVGTTSRITMQMRSNLFPVC